MYKKIQMKIKTIVGLLLISISGSKNCHKIIVLVQFDIGKEQKSAAVKMGLKSVSPQIRFEGNRSAATSHLKC